MRTIHPTPRSMQGLSIVELMVAMTLGLLLLAGLASIFASSSAARTEMERVSRQIENGRYAMDILTEDLRMAGFYGELNVASAAVPAALPDPCSVDPVVWNANLALAVQGFDAAVGSPWTCVPSNVKSNTDILVVRYVNTCEAGVGTCPGTVNNAPYVQVSKCSTQFPAQPIENLTIQGPPTGILPGYLLALQGSSTFPLRLRDCANRAGLRRYFVRIYFIATDNGKGQDIPTLTRVELDGLSWAVTPLVEGIEELNIEYGIDWTADGSPDGYNTDPTTYAGCVAAACTPTANWANVMTARINLLARNTEPSPNYNDTKKYSLGRDRADTEILIPGTGAYRRHAYTSAVRLINVAQRRERPA